MLCFTLYCTIVLISYASSKSTHNTREARWFGRTYTETAVQTEMVTAIIPSSCVHVEPTLPPCRGLRNLQSFPEFAGREIYPNHIKGRQLVPQPETLDKKQQQVVLAPLNETRVVGWAEYLGLVGPTFTVTELHLKTTTVIDPRTVVTFSVKGCKPSRLPMELDRCAVNQYSIEEILPSSVLPPSITTTLIPNSNLLITEGKRSKNIEVEPSSSDIVLQNLSFTPTEDLSDVNLSEGSS